MQNGRINMLERRDDRARRTVAVDLLTGLHPFSFEIGALSDVENQTFKTGSKMIRAGLMHARAVVPPGKKETTFGTTFIRDQGRDFSVLVPRDEGGPRFCDAITFTEVFRQSGRVTTLEC